jgi:formamidopyrimidine-DNA glycosylase
MPELPEVETIKNDLLNQVVGAQIADISYTDEGQKLIGKSGQNLVDYLPGERIKGAQRRAKYLILELSNGKKLVLHLKLTGRLLLRDQGSPDDEFTRLIISLDDGRQLRFADRNGFGEVRLAENIESIDPDLGPEPFELSNQAFGLALSRSTKETIKESLLDQSLVSGVGNIYADEALWLSGINPFRSPRGLGENEKFKLFESIKQALNEGIKHRGTTIDSYLDLSGRPGTHQFHLQVYGRTGKPCKRCATKIAYTEIKGRRTHFCPTCQPKEQLSLF